MSIQCTGNGGQHGAQRERDGLGEIDILADALAVDFIFADCRQCFTKT